MRGGTGRSWSTERAASRPDIAVAIVAAVTLVAAGLFPVGLPRASSQEPPSEGLAEARQHLDEAAAAQASLLADYDAATARLAGLDARAAQLDASIAATETAVVQAEARLEALLVEVVAIRAEAAAAARAAARAHRKLVEQAVAAYLGGSDPLALLAEVVEAGDVGRLQSLLIYAGAVLGHQQSVIDEFVAARDEATARAEALEATLTEVAGLRDQLRADRDRLEAERTELETVRAEAQDAVAHQQSLAATAEAQRLLYQDQVEALEAESARIEALLRERQRQEEAATTTLPPTTTPPDDGGGGPTTTTTEPPEDAVLDNPLDVMIIVSPFGWRWHPIYQEWRFHAGIDLDGDIGDPVYASADGPVIRAEWCGGYGNCVLVEHAGDLATLYAHLDSDVVGLGENVDQGELIGYVGNTGVSTGPHLHFEVRVDGIAVDPVPYLPL